MFVFARKCATHVRRAESNLWSAALFSHHVDPEDQAQVVRIGGKFRTQWAISQALQLLEYLHVVGLDKCLFLKMKDCFI